jgi:hypothetical protein
MCARTAPAGCSLRGTRRHVAMRTMCRRWGQRPRGHPSWITSRYATCRAYTHTHTHTHVHTHTYTDMHTHAYTCIYARSIVRSHMHGYTMDGHTHTHTHTNTSAHSLGVRGTTQEELEETKAPTVYDDYRFVTKAELDALALGHLMGTPLLRPYMHGFFIDTRLYQKVRACVCMCVYAFIYVYVYTCKGVCVCVYVSVCLCLCTRVRLHACVCPHAHAQPDRVANHVRWAQAKAVVAPFAYDEYKQQTMAVRLAQDATSRISLQRRLPRVNRAVAERLLAQAAATTTTDTTGACAIGVCECLFMCVCMYVRMYMCGCARVCCGSACFCVPVCPSSSVFLCLYVCACTPTPLSHFLALCVCACASLSMCMCYNVCVYDCVWVCVQVRRRRRIRWATTAFGACLRTHNSWLILTAQSISRPILPRYIHERGEGGRSICPCLCAYVCSCVCVCVKCVRDVCGERSEGSE